MSDPINSSINGIASDPVIMVPSFQQQMVPSVNQVFGLDELREMILGHVIRNTKDAAPCHAMIAALRLVRKDWLRTTTKILQKSRHPVFKLELNKRNSVDGSPYVRTHGKLLDQFINRVTRDDRIDPCVPPFSLKIMEDFFRQENHQSFSDLLIKCGGGLVELELFVPYNGGSLTCLFPVHVNLPLLKKLTVNLTEVKLKKLATGEVNYPYENNSTYLVHYLLNATKALKELALPHHVNSIFSFPSGFDLLTFPITLTKMELECKSATKELEMLARSNLPNLVILQLIELQVPFGDGLLFRVLDNFRSTLRTLEIIGLTYYGPPRRPSLFRFPVMEKLQRFSTSSIYVELETENPAPSLENYLPKLESLQLYDNTEGMLRKWTDCTKLTSLTHLRLRIVSDEVEESENSDYVLSLDTETMQRLHLAFPNVRRLDLYVSMGQTCGVKYLFGEMRQLTDLRIYVFGSPETMNSDLWDSLLIGVSVDLIAGLRASPEDWEVVRIDNDSRPSIKMLRGLTTFALVDLSSSNIRDAVGSMISDLAFHHAFLKMPQLKRLHFYGRVKASDEMVRAWRNQGNQLVYKAYMEW